MTGIPGATGTLEAFLADIEALLTSPAGRISVSSFDILDDVDPNLRMALLDSAAGEKPSNAEYTRDVLNTALGSAAATAGRLNPLIGVFGLVLVHGTRRYKRAKKHRHIGAASRDFTISRAALGLRESEAAALRGMATLYANDRIKWPQWRRFYVQLAWAGGKAEITAPAQWASSTHIDDARRYLFNLCAHIFPDHDQFIAQCGATLGDFAKETSELGRMITSLITTGARWMRRDDVQTSKVYKAARTPAALQIGGFKPGQTPVYFDGNESLATIAGAGTGKSAAQVIPNLLTYPGSCFVLDVKDELWEKTAGHRQRAFGPVYRFAPTDPTGYTHRYNPFDIIPLDAAGAERECQILASMIIPERPDNRDPFWDNKAREYLWAFSMAVAFNANPGWRNFASVSRLFAMQSSFADPLQFHTSDSKVILDGLDALALKLNMPSLSQSSTAIHNMLFGSANKTLQSIFDSARANLYPITRSPTATAAMAASDWQPLDLRHKPGMTVYLCLKPDDMKAYAPLVRLIFQQHVSQLTRNFTPKKGELPVTFFLDEMPQLGYMPNMTDLVDVGRGAAVRLWMFMQYMGQLKAVYQVKGPGLIEACRVRSYMSPDTESYNAIKESLGETRNIFSGERKPLAYAHELAGREFEDDVVVIARGEHPARLAKLPYFHDRRLTALTEIPPPHVLGKAPPPSHRPSSRTAAGQTTPGQQGQPAQHHRPRVVHAAAAPALQRSRDPVIRPRQT